MIDFACGFTKCRSARTPYRISRLNCGRIAAAPTRLRVFRSTSLSCSVSSRWLHVPRIAILLNDGASFKPAYALGYASPPSVTITEQSLTVRRLRKQQHALVAFDDAES